MIIEDYFEKELNKLSKEEKDELLKLQKSSKNTPEEGANAFYQGTRVYSMFINKSILPILNAQLKLNDREKILRGLFIRVVLKLEALMTLQSPKYFEAVASTLRTIFEIMVDVILISDNTIPNGVEKYYKFVDAQKYEYARKYIDNCDYSKMNEMEKGFYDSSKKHVSDMDAKINFPVFYQTHWGQDEKPPTWTGKDIFKNAEDAGCSILYRYIYARICWDTHSGITNILGLEKDYFPSAFALHHGYIHKFTTEIIKRVAREFHLYKVAPGLNKALKTIDDHVGYVLLKGHIDKIIAKRKK